ncbi:MAG: DUF4185 domain-containing protein [Nitriliruptorales bacterium]
MTLVLILAVVVVVGTAVTVLARSPARRHLVPAPFEPGIVSTPMTGTDVRVEQVEVVAQLTGAGSPNRTAERWDVAGTDLGHSFRHGDSLYMVFGDTFGQGWPQRRGNWRSNVLARVDDLDPSDGLDFATMVTDARGRAREILPSLKIPGIERTVIPTGGASLGDRMLLHYMSVSSWGGHGHWRARHAGLAVSADGGETWTRPPGAIWDGEGNFVQVDFAEDEGWLYMLGIPAGRDGGAALARVEPDDATDKGAYEYWDGRAWVRGDEHAAVTVVEGPVGELSLRWSPRFERWLLMYLHEANDDVVLRTAPELTGPWDEPRIVVTAKQWPQPYGPYFVPLDGDEVYFTLSRFDFYNVYLLRLHLGGDDVIVAAPEAGGIR